MVTRIWEEMMDSIYGIVPPVVTPFREDDSIDEGAFRAEIQYMIETAKVHGLAVTGSTGSEYKKASE